MKWFGGALVVMLGCFFSCSTQTGTTNNDLARWQLKGNVAAITEITYSKSGKYRTNILFNKAGFVTEQVSYNPDQSLIRRWMFDYQRDTLKSRMRCYIGNDSLAYTLAYQYHPNNQLASVQRTNADGSFAMHTAVQYDPDNRKVKNTSFSSDQRVEHETTLRYASDLLAEETFFDASLNQRWKQVYQYDKEGRKTETLFLSMDDSVMSKKVYRYTDTGKVMENTSFQPADKLTDKITFQYNEHGDETERVQHVESGAVVVTWKRNYRYDPQGNWTFMAVTENDEQKDIVTRAIRYYE